MMNLNLFKININPNRIFGLDILRALAILFVVIGHSAYLVPAEYKFILKKITFDGVAIFFVLSGFLIGGILIRTLETKKANWKTLGEFWVKRWFRTLPNYFLILLLIIIYDELFKPSFNFLEYSSYFIFSQNLFSDLPPFFLESWSLSVEEWFYLLIPLAIYFFIRITSFSTKNAVLTVIILLIALVTCYRYQLYLNIPDNITANEWDLLFRKRVSTRLDSLMFGVLGAFISHYFVAIWTKHKLKLLICGIGLILASKYVFRTMVDKNSLYECVFSFSVMSIATLLLLPYLGQLKKVKKTIFFKWTTYISLTSYSMYLIHYTLIRRYFLENIFSKYFCTNENCWMISYGLFWGLTIFCSILLYKYFEIPLMNLRDHKLIRRLFS